MILKSQFRSKGIAPLIAVMLIAVGIGIIVFAGSRIIGTASLTGEIVNGCTLQTGLKVIPLVGYYSCEPQGYKLVDVQAVPDTSVFTFLSEWTIYCNYNMESCTFILTNVNGTREISSVTVPRGGAATYKKDSTFTGQRFVYVYGTPFALVRYSPVSSPEIVSQSDCRLPSTSNLITKIFNYAKVVGSGSLSLLVHPTDSLDFNQKSGFLADWAVSPVEYNYDSSNGKYCSPGGYLYQTQTVQLQSGCYLSPDLSSAPSKVLGCPGEPCSVGGQSGVVDKSYNCILPEKVECDALNPCPGFGKYAVDFSKDSSGSTSVTYNCVSNKCVPSWVKSTCATNSACLQGTSCQFDSSTGQGTCIKSSPSSVPVTGVSLPSKFNLVSWAKGVFFALFGSGILVGIVVISGSFFPPLMPFSMILRQPKFFGIAVIVLTIVLTAVFNLPVGSIVQGAIT